MNATLKTFRYLVRGYSVMATIAAISILSCVAIVNLVFRLTDGYDGAFSTPTGAPLTVPTEVTAWIFALVTGIALFLTNFKVMLVSGVSRKTFWLASLPAAALLAATLAFFNLLVVAIHGLWWPLVLISELIFPGLGWIGLFLIQFARNLMSLVLGWFIVLAYYRSSRLMKWVISLAPVALISLLLTANAQTQGDTGAGLQTLWQAAMRSSPAAAALTMLFTAAVVYGLVYLLLRRAPLD
jgi:hypothetical protein